MKQSQWSSRLGYILAAAGSAVGLGAIWKFPYVTAANGGGAFLLVFLLFSFTLGVAVLMGETLLGSLTRRGVVGAFDELMGKRWRWVGAMGLLCSLLIFSFYSVVGGWTLGYTGMALAGSLQQGDGAALTARFNDYVGDPLWPVLTHLLFAALTWWFVQGGGAEGGGAHPALDDAGPLHHDPAAGGLRSPPAQCHGGGASLPDAGLQQARHVRCA